MSPGKRLLQAPILLPLPYACPNSDLIAVDVCLPFLKASCICRLPASAAAQLDPQQRLLLEAAAEVMWASSQGPAASAENKIATYVGISWTEYAAMATAHGMPTGALSAQSSVLSVSVGEWYTISGG